jgi:hypothetical protein
MGKRRMLNSAMLKLRWMVQADVLMWMMVKMVRRLFFLSTDELPNFILLRKAVQW